MWWFSETSQIAYSRKTQVLAGRDKILVRQTCESNILTYFMKSIKLQIETCS